MKYMEYQEKSSHERIGFPFSYYDINPSHPNYNMTPHWHDEYEFIRVNKGEFNLMINNSLFTLKKGDTSLVSNGFLHSGIPNECFYECIVFDLDFYIKNHSNAPEELKAILNQQKRMDTLFCSAEKEFQDIISVIFDALKEKYSGYTLIAEGALWQLLGLIIQKKRYTVLSETNMTYTKKFKEIKIVLNYIALHYNNDISLNDLAGCIHMNPNYFCKFFRELMQKSPIEYLNEYRIEKACEMLRIANNSVLNTALDCGFNDVNYFIKVFKRYKGTTPLQYAKRSVAAM